MNYPFKKEPMKLEIA